MAARPLAGWKVAITKGDRMVWRDLRAGDYITPRPAVLEIGRANWFGDITAAEFHADRRDFDPDGRTAQPAVIDPWTVADWYYAFMLRNPDRTAIDLDPEAKNCLRLDLNKPLPEPLHNTFKIVINTGTAEHIFDQRNVWEAMHDACVCGGLMVHALPLWGWLDHGFVNYQPTFVADLARANNYEIVSWWYAEPQSGVVAPVEAPETIHTIARSGLAEGSALMHVAFRKDSSAGGFRVPQQGVYTGSFTDEELRAWKANR